MHEAHGPLDCEFTGGQPLAFHSLGLWKDDSSTVNFRLKAW
jgi:hypothetical protein